MEGFPGAVFHAFDTFDEAINFVAENTLNDMRTTAAQPEKEEYCSSICLKTLKKAGQRNKNARVSPLATPITEFTPMLTTPKVTEQGTTNGTTDSNTNFSPYRTPPTSPDLSRRTLYVNGRISNPPFNNCSAEQREILSLVSKGRNVFFTGSAGTGKTFVVQRIRLLLESLGFMEYSDFFVTASTGIIRG